MNRSKSGTRLLVSRGLPFALSVAVLGGPIGCTENADIQLKGSGAPVPQEPAVPGPLTPASSPTPEPTASPSPEPTPVAVTQYRVLCDGKAPSPLVAISSLAGPTGFGASIVIEEVGAGGEVDPSRARLEDFYGPAVVELPQSGQMRAVFSALKPGPRATDPKEHAVFVADLDLVGRVGKATRLGRVVEPDSGLQSFARTEGLTLRTYGVSDLGRYILVANANGYEIIDAKSLKSLGLARVGSPEAFVNPTLREADGVLVVTKRATGALESQLYQLKFSPSGSLAASSRLGSVGGLRYPLRAISMQSGDLFYALSSRAQENSVVTMDPLSKKPTTFVLEAVPQKGKLAPAAALWHDAGGALKLTTVYEEIEMVGSWGSLRTKVGNAFVRISELNNATLTADKVGQDLDYPRDARVALESNPTVGAVSLGVTEIQVSPDGNAIFALFPGSSSSRRLYRLAPVGFVGVSQVNCEHASIGVEP